MSSAKPTRRDRDERIDRNLYRRHLNACAYLTGRTCSCDTDTYVIDLRSKGDKKHYLHLPNDDAARGWKRDREARLRGGIAPSAMDITVRELVAEWKERANPGDGRWFKRGGEEYKPSSYETVCADLDTLWVPRLGKLKVTDVLANHISPIVTELVQSGEARATVKRKLNALRVLFRYATSAQREGGMIRVDSPVVHVEARGRSEQQRAYFESVADFMPYVMALPREYDRCLWATAALTGIRRGELGALRRRDVDVADRVIYVRQAWDYHTHCFGLVKSRRGFREVPIFDKLLPFIELRLLSIPDDPDALLFPGTYNKGVRPFSPTGLAKRAKTAWKNARLHQLPVYDGDNPDVVVRWTWPTLHVLRHTWATFFVGGGVDIIALARWIGHDDSQLRTRYAHPVRSQAMIDMANDLLGDE